MPEKQNYFIFLITFFCSYHDALYLINKDAADVDVIIHIIILKY